MHLQTYAFKTVAQSNTFTYTLLIDTPASGEVLKVTSVSGSGVTLEWGVGGSLVTVEEGTTNNSTLRWDGTKWAENTGVTSNGTNLSVSGGTVTSQSANLSNLTNQLVLGTTKTTTISAVQPSVSRTYSIPDAGANASFVMTEGAQTVNGAKTFGSSATFSSDATFDTTAKLKSSDGTGGIALQAGAMGSTNYTYTMPTSAPSSTQALKVSSFDGTTAVLEWGSISNVDLSAPGPIGGTTPSSSTFTTTTFNTSAKLKSTDGTGGITLKAGALGTTNYNYILPIDAPSTNEVLKVSAVGGSNITLEWGTGGADLSTPGVIGSTTPNSANFTTVNVTNTTNQLVLGTSPNTTTINAVAPTAARTYSIPDAGANASFVMTEGSQTINGTKTFGTAPVLSSLTASRPLKLDGSKNIVSMQIDLASTNDVTGTLPVGNGGTGLTTYATGDIVYASTTNTLAKLGIGSSGQVLTVSGGLPKWGSGMPAGTTANSTLRYNGTSWVENTSVLAASDGATTLTKTTNQIVLGTINTTTINAAAPTASRTYTIPDAGANASFVMTAGDQTISGTKTIGGAIVGSPAAIATVSPAATPGNTIGSLTGLYNKVTVNAPTAAQFIKLPAGTADGQVAYLRLAFTDGGSATNTVTLINSDAGNTATAALYDGQGADVIMLHMIYDSATTRWTLFSIVYNP
jgi:hypothetical protein